jgi:hypothetical protein
MSADDAAEADALASLMEQGRAHRQRNELVAAIDAFAAAVAIAPEDEGALEHLSLALTAERRLAEARSYQVRLQALQARRLPHRLNDGLAAIWQRTQDIARDDLNPEAVDWAWELADRSAYDRAAWLAAAAWGSGARLLLRQWWEAAPTRELRQIEDLVEPPDLSEVRTALVERNGCILAAAHVGPTAAAVDMFRRGNWPFRTLGTPDRDRTAGDTMVPIIAKSTVTMRTIINQIRNGTMIGLSADAPIARDRLGLEFLGREIELPVQVPKLIQRYETASFWCCPLWCNGRIAIELKRLPDPVAGEARDAWCERWFAAYLEELETVMRGRPENLGLFSGIWANVNPAVLRWRATQPSRIRRPQPRD